MKINVFLPCKKNSSRLKNKNKRKFADIDFGLVKIKLNHLINSKLKTESFPIRKSFLQENTWDNRCKQVNEELKKLY